ncbi:MAG TPA: endonuclease/exonuclease/phosphatase family protein [Flavobacteriaceae bacterium]|nr:endonuclease/exonuclease/phosphatase family protein [Flavobacteriaceae bacterium]
MAFYNQENLFDTVDDPKKYDENSPIMEIPEGKRAEAYRKKLHNMAFVISQIGKNIAKNSPAVLGVCEVENKKALQDLVNQPELIGKNYGIIHYPGPDERSIDVAFLYQKGLFRPIRSSSHGVVMYDEDDPEDRDYTRDQLLVTGLLDGDKIHFIVNHWPSRGGGEAASEYKRLAAATVNKRLIDSLQTIDPYAKIITMGDFNDNPYNKSIKKILEAKGKQKKVGLKDLYNPYEQLHKRGIGTGAYRDGWDLFDQIMMSAPFLQNDYSSYRFYKAFVFNPNYLLTPNGEYEGYPFRSYSNGRFSGGYSDHFPVYVYLIKAVE